ncbi:hypothetical protein [Aestuariicoccus sp. MJ-SS9]|uniref:hypothetical protein n=1 Tax=Aestuariicoccus sp. MJ-SS9 TaxID=3079855 RepID=UPI002913C7E6|nr:hypothetical protein [Aestuariicoccus sp. MJ-SS9]MDU8912449.1 hypothetical protein [Aestuariicoccus sp. MJ-SS9]
MILKKAALSLCLGLAGLAAEAQSLMGEDGFARPRTALIPDLGALGDAAKASGRASLFAGLQGDSFFARSPAPIPRKRVGAGVLSGQGGAAAMLLRHLIAEAEAGPQGYDAVQHGARIRPPKRPTRMSIAEIYRWIDDTPGQPHAIGRYQFIPATLRRMVDRLGVDERVAFSPLVQDRLADLLLEEAGLSAFRAGGVARQDFMNNLARIWAGLPNSSGLSHYHGYAGNRATMSWAQFETAMARIFPPSIFPH